MTVGAGFKPALHAQSRCMMLIYQFPHIMTNEHSRQLTNRVNPDDSRLPREGGFETRPYFSARMRSGFNTTSARRAAMTLRADAVMNTAVQLPVAVVSTLPKGTRRAAVPLAV
jgi:hypothetical protein